MYRSSTTEWTGRRGLDFDQMARLAREHRPKVIVVGATAYPRIIDSLVVGSGRRVGAYLMADIATSPGWWRGITHRRSGTSRYHYYTHKTLRVAGP